MYPAMADRNSCHSAELEKVNGTKCGVTCQPYITTHSSPDPTTVSFFDQLAFFSTDTHTRSYICSRISFQLSTSYLPSVLWRCWLGGRKGIWPVKNRMVGCWRGYLSGATSKLAYSPAAQMMPLPLTVSCFSKLKSKLVLPFWYRLTWVVPEKGPLKTRARVCVYKLQCEKFAKICNKDSLFLYAKKSF